MLSTFKANNFSLSPMTARHSSSWLMHAFRSQAAPVIIRSPLRSFTMCGKSLAKRCKNHLKDFLTNAISERFVPHFAHPMQASHHVGEKNFICMLNIVHGNGGFNNCDAAFGENLQYIIAHDTGYSALA